MNYFMDCEFLEGKQNKRFLGIKYGETKPTIDLISIGIVSEDNREYYAISKDFNLKEAWNRNDLDPNHKRNYKQKDNYWIRENVLKPIFNELVLKYALIEEKAFQLGTTSGYNPPYKFNYKNTFNLINLFGKTNKQIADEIKLFTMHYSENKNEIWDKPKFYAYFADYDWVAFCWLFGKMIDLPKDFPMYCKDLKQILDEKTTLDLKNKENYPKQEKEHNALEDAKWNKYLYFFLNEQI